MEKAVVIVPDGIIGSDAEHSVLVQLGMLASDLGYELERVTDKGEDVPDGMTVLYACDGHPDPVLPPEAIAFFYSLIVYRGELTTDGLWLRYFQVRGDYILSALASVVQIAMSVARPSGMKEDAYAATDALYWCFGSGISRDRCRQAAEALASRQFGDDDCYVFDENGFTQALQDAHALWKAARAEWGDAEPVDMGHAPSWDEVLATAAHELGIVDMMEAYQAGVPFEDIVGQKR